MEGLRERIEVGVDEIDEDVSEDGYCSLNLEGARRGEDVPEVGVLTVGLLVGDTPSSGADMWWSGEAGRRRLEREPVLLYKLDSEVPSRGVSSNSASSEISHTLGAPSKEPADAGRMPEPYRSCGLPGTERCSRPRGLRVRLGERRGEDERPWGTGERESGWKSGRFILVGSEWARAMRGALSVLDPLCERR